MARRNNSNTQSDTQSTPEAPEATVTSTTTEAPVEPTSTETTTEAPATEAPAKPETDITPFLSAADEALATADSSTGDVPVPGVEAVVKAYKGLDGAANKRAAKKHIGEAMLSAMVAKDFGLARSWLSFQQAVDVAPASSAAPRTPVDPTEAFVQRVVGLTLAAELAKGTVPEGVAEDWSTKANDLITAGRTEATDYLAWTNREAPAEGTEDVAEPEVAEFVKAAVKLALGKSAKVGTVRKAASTGEPRAAYTGTRRDVAAHINEAFADKEAGAFMTVNEIRAFASSQYEANTASAGAISARLKSEKGVDGFAAGTNEAGRFGARKLG